MCLRVLYVVTCIVFDYMYLCGYMYRIIACGVQSLYMVTCIVLLYMCCMRIHMLYVVKCVVCGIHICGVHVLYVAQTCYIYCMCCMWCTWNQCGVHALYVVFI